MMRTPANAGPMVRVRLAPELLREMAFIRPSWGTMSDTRACRLGILIAIRDPLNDPMAIRCQNRIIPVKSSVASKAVRSAFPAWAAMITCFLDTRSANAPPKRDIQVIGRENAIITKDRASGESFDNRSTSQPLAIICMAIAKKFASVPIQSHRKSRY